MSRFPLISLIVAALSLVLASGCADDLRGRDLFEAGAGDAKIRFSVDNISLTRAEGEADIESAIDHAYLLFYSEDASLATSSPIAAVKAEVSETALTFKMPLTLQAGTDYQLVAIANADNYIPEGYGSFAEYLQGWTNAENARRGEMLLNHSERILASGIDCLPMRGVIPEGEPFRFSMQNGAYSVSASLTFRRAVARIDVANIVKEGFTVEGVALCNWRDAVAAAASEGNLGNRLGTVRGVLSDADEDNSDDIFIEMPAADESGIQKMEKSIYCFPSANYDTYPSDKESTALIIKARYSEDEASTYYRVNVGTSGNRALVKANTKYLVTIQSVKGSGALTAEEAYAAEESPIVLSVVEDWDLDGGSYAMDADGNFIVLSTGRLEFEGDDVANREVKVLTSRGLTWDMEYIPDNEESAGAFSATLISENSLVVSVAGVSPDSDVLSGRYMFSAQTPQGGGLSVALNVLHKPMQGNTPTEPVIPEDMPFALIPESYDRVNIDHVKKTIEIDGFDPDCFNSFIDVPFKVYIKDPSMPSVNISTTLQWPLEGRISLDDASQYTYCKESFAASGARGVRLMNGTVSSDINLGKQQIMNVIKDAYVKISVGAMGPDDPAISGRTVTIQGNDGMKVEYELIVKPRPCIIDDVILRDTSGNLWLVQDRNIQDFKITVPGAKDCIGLDAEGKKHQAYNYTYISIWFNNNHSLTIPFKFKKESETLSENGHPLYFGQTTVYKQRSDLAGNENSEGSRLYWLKKYSYSGEMTRMSPFYEGDGGEYGFNKWVFPTESLFETLKSKLRVSKMRMYFVSEVKAKGRESDIDICCYLPYHSYDIGDTSTDSYGYGVSADGEKVTKLIILNIDHLEVKGVSTTGDNYFVLSRLVRPLTEDELEEYKTNYLGYGSQPHRLTLCHPDTYESTSLGWLPY